MASDEMDRLLQNLRRLNLRHAANNLDEHLRQAAQLKLGHLPLLARIAKAEVRAREERAAGLRMKQADFPEILLLEDYDFNKQPSLNHQQILTLAELGFVDKRENVIWIGPSGVGKTYLAIALGVRACQAAYKVRFYRSYKLLRALYASLADDTLDDQLYELGKPDLLIIDELSNSPRKPEVDFAGVFFELVEWRHRRGSIVLTTNLGFNEWPSALGSASQVTPALDRLIEGAHIITFPNDAESYRAERTKSPGPLPPRRNRKKRNKDESRTSRKG